MEYYFRLGNKPRKILPAKKTYIHVVWHRLKVDGSGRDAFLVCHEAMRHTVEQSEHDDTGGGGGGGGGEGRGRGPKVFCILY